jgi:outer membrane protein TolC
LNVKPRLDLVAGTYLTALDERTVSRALDRWVGPSLSLSLEYERPLGNNTYRGQLAQREADTRGQRITSVDTGRQIELGIVRTAGLVREAVARVRQAEAAVAFATKTVESETERYKMGDVTLLDTVLTRQQQTDAELALVTARQELAREIAQYRYQTGTLVGSSVDPSALVTLPVRRQP